MSGSGTGNHYYNNIIFSKFNLQSFHSCSLVGSIPSRKAVLLVAATFKSRSVFCCYRRDKKTFKIMLQRGDIFC